MGRSVSYLSNAHTVVYCDTSHFGLEQCAECEECGECYYHPYQDDSEPETTICCDIELSYEDYYREDHGDWDWFIEDITEQFIAKYPSLELCDKWEGNEDRIFLENNLIEVGVSEYCGLTSVSVRPKENSYDSRTDNLAKRMVGYVGKWMEANLGDYNKVGTFSNGESVYERK